MKAKTCALIACAVCATASLNATVLTVTSLADSGAGSLRDQVAASGTGDTINFAVTGTITLSSAINITHTLNVLGPGPSGLVVNANQVDRAFAITGSSTITTISGITVSNGFVMGTQGADGAVGENGADGGDAFGGGIYDQGVMLVLSNCWLTRNVVEGGQGGRGGANVIGATYFAPGNGGTGGEAEGGAVYSTSPLMQALGCTFSDNRATGGVGGKGGTNVASNLNPGGTGGQGGIAQGGAMQPGGSPTGLTNCTFSANRIGGGQGGPGGDNTDNGPGGTGGQGGESCGGAIASFNPCAFLSSTIVSNIAFAGPAGLGGAGATTGPFGTDGPGMAGGICGYTISCNNPLANTILADNFATTRSSNYFAALKDIGYNFIGSDDFAPCPWGPTSQVGTVPAPIHPLLGPLAQNGGGLPTHATRYSIPATVTDQGNSFGNPMDERGAPRPYIFPLIPEPAGSDGSDIGAFELGNTNLGAAVVSNNLVLSWPASYGDFIVQSTPTLQGSNAWNNVSNAPVVISNQFVITIPITNGAQFYRMVSQ